MYQIQFEHDNGARTYEKVASKQACKWWSQIAITSHMLISINRQLVGYKVRGSKEITWIN